MLILARQDVESILTMGDAITAVEEGFRRLASGKVIMPQRAVTPIAPHNGLHLSMPAFVDGDPGTLSIKIVTVYENNKKRFGLPAIQGLLLLYDVRNGQALAMMDAEYLTAMRTGAASGVATKYLARSNAKTVTLFGAGAQADAQLEAVCAVRPIRRAIVITRTGSKDDAFCARMQALLGIKVSASRDVRSAVQAADVICTATNSQTPLFDGNWLQPGTHINAVGAYTHAMRELDATTIQRSRVFVDQHTAALTEAGDILLAIEEGKIEYGHIIGELGELIGGAIPGRSSSEEITVFKSVGLAVQDAMTVAHIYKQALKRGIGQEVDL